MGVLDFFKKKKDDDNLESSGFQSQWPSQGRPFHDEQGFAAHPGFDQDSFNSDPMQNLGQQQGFPIAQQNPGPFTPEQAGFERVRDSYPQAARGRENVSDINMGKDLELINAKLDAIKAELDSVNQRLKRMERLNDSEQGVKKDPWSY